MVAVDPNGSTHRKSQNPCKTLPPFPPRGFARRISSNTTSPFDRPSKPEAENPGPLSTSTGVVRCSGKTRYTSIARHWTVKDRELHEKMGFQPRLEHLHRPVRRPGRAAAEEDGRWWMEDSAQNTHFRPAESDDRTCASSPHCPAALSETTALRPSAFSSASPA